MPLRSFITITAVCFSVLSLCCTGVCEVYPMQETSDKDGYASQVYVIDPYWTNQKNVSHYHYTVRISKNGEIYLAPVSD